MSINSAMRIGTGLAIVCSAMITTQAMAARKQGRPAIVGRWDMTVTENGQTYPCWLGVERVDGKRVAQFQARWAGVSDIKDGVNFDAKTGTVDFNAWGREWTGKIKRGKIEGTYKSKKVNGTWTAKRFVATPDLSGKWTLKLGEKTATLVLKGEKKNIEGTWTQDGKDTAISKARQNGARLTFSVGDQAVQAKACGDVLEGKLQDSSFTGQRERKWGKPIELFAGKAEDLAANWEPVGGQGHSWKVIDGVMTNGDTIDPAKAVHKGTENIVTKRKDFKNFKLHVEFMVPEHGNSGVYLRGRYEVQVEDSYGKAMFPGVCGSLYTRILPTVNACKKPGEWQNYDITLIDSYVTVVQNGKTIIDNQEIKGITGGALDSDEAAPGPIYLQGDHSQNYYRKVVLTPAE